MDIGSFEWLKSLVSDCRVGIDAPFIYLFINARNHNTPHRTVLEDFPHTALQFNSHCMW